MMLRRVFLRREQEPDAAVAYRNGMRKSDEGSQALRLEPQRRLNVAFWSGLSWRLAAATFSSRNLRRLVPGIGTMSSPLLSSPASAICPGVMSSRGNLVDNSGCLEVSVIALALGNAGRYV